MQREEKQLDLTLDALVTRLNELKNQLHALLFKIEHETQNLNWPSLLDNLALISGQYTAITKALSPDKAPPLRNLTILPLLLSPDKDDELLQLTEGRIPAFGHDLVPDYLRTKLEPDIEMKMQQFIHKANGLTMDVSSKQMAAFNKVLNHVLDIMNKSREEWESEAGARSGIGTTSNLNDTHVLVSVVSMGKGLKPMPPQGGAPSPMMSNVRPTGPPPPQGPPGSMGPNAPMNMMPKAPSSIKTNIKAGSQMHPYR